MSDADVKLEEVVRALGDREEEAANRVEALEEALRAARDYVQDAIDHWPATSLEHQGAVEILKRVNRVLGEE